MLPPISEQAQEHEEEEPEPEPEPLAEVPAVPPPSPHTPCRGEVLGQLQEEDEEQSQLPLVAQAQRLQERGDEQAQAEAQTTSQPHPSTLAQEQPILVQEEEEAAQHPRDHLQAVDESQPRETTTDSRSSSLSLSVAHDRRIDHERGRSDGSLASAIVTASTLQSPDATGDAPLEDSDESMDEALRLEGLSAGQRPMRFL